MTVTVIANPAAGGGRAARLIARLRPVLAARGVPDIRVTARPTDLAAFVRAAIDDGARTLVALGGDGTWSQVAGAIAAAGAPVRLALLAAGTGNDFAKTLGVPAHDFDATWSLIETGAERAIDMGRVDDRYFLNVAGFGIDAHVVRHQLRAGWLPARASYAMSAAQQLRGFRGIRARVDDGPLEESLALIFANGRRFGGVFSIAPDASVDDGELDFVRIANAPTLTRTRLLLAAIGGTHVDHALVRVRRAATFRLTFQEPPCAQLDGELYQLTDRAAVVSVVPGALRLAAR